MADISDVEEIMVGLIAGYLRLGAQYLHGSAVSSPVTQTQCKIFRGWPTAAALDEDLAAGISNVSIFPVAGAGRRTTRYVPQWNPGRPIVQTLYAHVVGSDIIISGTASTGQVVCIEFGYGVNPSTFSYRPSQSDNPTTIAAALGAMIPGSTVTGPVVTIQIPQNLYAGVVLDNPMWMETRRQEQHVWVIGWCPDPFDRDRVMSAIDAGFGSMMTAEGNLTDQFPLPDGSSARLLYMSSHTDDQPQKAGVWRRDLRYIVSYPTTITSTFPTMTFGTSTITETISGNVVNAAVGPEDLT